MYLVNFKESVFMLDSQVSTIYIRKINDYGFLEKYPNAHVINAVGEGMSIGLEMGYYANEEEAHKEMMGFLSAVNSGQEYYVFRNGSISSDAMKYLEEVRPGVLCFP